MEHQKILLVDDEPNIIEFLEYNLRKEGYEVHSCNNGKAALALAQELKPHLIVLDVMMPGMDGIETCKEIRQIPALKNPIIIFLSARGEDYSQIAGFEAGADDYVAKPVKPRVLISRINAFLKRHKEEHAKESGQIIQLKEMIIDRNRYVVLKDGKEYTLPRKEFELLSLLASKPDRVITREEIFSSIWGNDVIVGNRTIDVHLRKIREKLGMRNIRTIKGVGFKYEDFNENKIQ
jgi:two-component system alkaline phosphatase synthesis response regulator PhoP